MSGEKDELLRRSEVPDGSDRRVVSRREFLRLAGVAGAAVGVGAGLGGLLAACGEETTTETSAAPTTTGAPDTTEAASTTTTAGTSTTAGATEGREVKLGIVAPVTGPLASFAVATSYCMDKWAAAVPNGVVLGDGQNHKITVKLVDSQSDTNRAAQVAADLILNDKVDMIMVSASPDTVVPVADQCETNGTPCIAVWCPWEPFFFGRGGTPDKPFKWTYLACPGAQDIMLIFADMWEQLPTNKTVGLLLANDADGNAWADKTAGLPPILDAKGYTTVMPDLYASPADDFTAQIAAFKKEGCEICAGSLIPPDFANFWKQAVQQSYNPKFLTIGKALLFPESLQAVGSIAYNATVELSWHANWPFVSSFTGETCQELADDFEAKTGQQWTATLSQYQLFEWAVDVLKRTANIDDKETIAAAINTTKATFISGLTDFTVPVDMAGKHPVLNVYKPVMGGGQWIKGTKHDFEIVQVSNFTDPEIPVAAEMLPMEY